VNCIGKVQSSSSEIDKTTNKMAVPCWILKRKTIRGLQMKIKLHRGGGSPSVGETRMSNKFLNILRLREIVTISSGGNLNA
jgi:hypothetical protein